ncbi:FAD/NAD(P)-binding protein [Streptomyces hypolithicus]
MSAVHQALALVGAGPRGTSALERLCASVPALAPQTPLTVHVVDPAPPGAGQVWRTGQSAELLMNTVASQVTLFTDASVACEGPIRPGPSLYEWAASGAPGTAPADTGLGPDDYPTRACYGRYLEWVFQHVVRDAPRSVTVRVHAARAVRLQDAPDSTQTLTLDNGETLTRLGAVILTQGHLPSHPAPSDTHLSAYAAQHGLRHLPPANPADLGPALSALGPGEPVILRGLGLNFFDHMALLTSGRGGTYTRDTRSPHRTGLVYRPSGREPRLYAGSRRGVPHQARGDNAKGPYGRHEPLLLTPPVIAALRARADTGDPPDFLGEIWPLVAKEVETVYYEALLGPAAHHPAAFRSRFLATPHRSAQEAEVLADFGVPHGERWCWDLTARPYTGRTFRDPADHRAWLLDHLRQDAAHAALGNVAGPLKAALDVLRDLRNELRQIVDHAGLPGASRRDHLDRWYTPLNAFLSIGPPRRRIEEMTALIEAGVLDVIGPRATVTTEGGRFVAFSPDVPGSAVAADALVEARLPEPDLRRTSDELLARLLKTGQCRPHTVDGYETGGLDVTRRPYHLIDRQGRVHAQRFAFGVPTEGVHWVTAAGARPGVDSVTLTDADAVARAALRVAAAVTAVGVGVRTTMPLIGPPAGDRTTL